MCQLNIGDMRGHTEKASRLLLTIGKAILVMRSWSRSGFECIICVMIVWYICEISVHIIPWWSSSISRVYGGWKHFHSAEPSMAYSKINTKWVRWSPVNVSPGVGSRLVGPWNSKSKYCRLGDAEIRQQGKILPITQMLMCQSRKNEDFLQQNPESWHNSEWPRWSN